MSAGIIFDIKEFAVFDGPGIRTSVFFKGCSMRCRWCHNPEGFSFEPQIMINSKNCVHCGRCKEVCPCQDKSSPFPPKDCNNCFRCISVCPQGIRRLCGVEYTAENLAKKLLRDSSYLKKTNGGYTMSGGEPTGQGEFLLELLERLRGNHRAMETSGFCSSHLFSAILKELELVIMDIKLTDRKKHLDYIGVDNTSILENLELLKISGKPHIIRIPCIPGVNDNDGNFETIADLLHDDKNLIKVELLPYHKTAGAKYCMLNIEYQPGFNVEQAPSFNTSTFLSQNIPCSVI